jgi:hypothetical protein
VRKLRTSVGTKFRTKARSVRALTFAAGTRHLFELMMEFRNRTETTLGTAGPFDPYPMIGTTPDRCEAKPLVIAHTTACVRLRTRILRKIDFM